MWLPASLQHTLSSIAGSVCAAMSAGAVTGVFRLLLCEDESVMKKNDIAEGSYMKGRSSKVEKIEKKILKFNKHVTSRGLLMSVEHLLTVNQQLCSVAKMKNQS